MDLLDLKDVLTEEDVLDGVSELRPGGEWKPESCRARHRIAVIIAYRDRHKELNVWFMHMIPIFQRQMLDFRIIIAEQNGTNLFNKGKLFNAAFAYVESFNVSCVVFHDVDLYPEDDRNLYSCFDAPRHMAPYVNTLGYSLMYNQLVGGVLNVRVELFRAMNGFSNKYWGWGGEDDDFGLRMIKSNVNISRPNHLFGRYTMAKHVHRKNTEAYPKRWHLLNTAFVRMPTDGFSNVTTECKVVEIAVKPLYHHLLIDVGDPLGPTITTNTATTVNITSAFRTLTHNAHNDTITV